MNLRKLFKSTNRKTPNSDGTVEASDIYYTPHNSHVVKNSFPNASFVSNDDLIKFETNQNQNNGHNETRTLINPQDCSKNSPQIKQRNSKNLLIHDLKKVNLSDEYTDPFDKLALVDNTEPGYMEPYKQQGLNFLPKRQVQRANYEDPWDHKKRMVQPNYENPWDNQTTKYNKDSLESPSSSRSSLSKSRMVKLTANDGSSSPKISPSRSPRLDRRLIRPPNHEFKVPVTNKQFDERLVKAEPSIDQLRYQTSRGNFQPPVEANQNHQMASTLGPHNVHRFSMTKSHSLNFSQAHNEAVNFPKTGKSVSDDHLVHHHVQASSEHINYEDPWDKNPAQNHIHLRSRSYDLRPFPAQQVIHEKSSSFDSEQQTCYEQPWDRKTFQQLRSSEAFPEDHCEFLLICLCIFL